MSINSSVIDLAGSFTAAVSLRTWTGVGIIELHATMHERLDLLLLHAATVPDDLHNKLIPGFGHPSIWNQLVHIITCEEGWIHDVQNKVFPGWREEDCQTMAAMLAAKDRVRKATPAYLEKPI